MYKNTFIYLQKKIIDKRLPAWYNKYSQEEKQLLQNLEKNLEKVEKTY